MWLSLILKLSCAILSENFAVFLAVLRTCEKIINLTLFLSRQANQDVLAQPEQPDHRGLPPLLLLRDHPGAGLLPHLRAGLPLHLHGQGLGPHGRLHPLLRLDVLQDLEGPLHLHQRPAQQKGAINQGQRGASLIQ